jgi:glutamate--cysteine ligase
MAHAGSGNFQRRKRSGGGRQGAARTATAAQMAARTPDEQRTGRGLAHHDRLAVHPRGRAPAAEPQGMTTTVFKDDSQPVETLDDLVQHFRAGEKPREQWRIGTEHEKLAFSRSTHEPLPFGGERGIFAILEAFRTRFGWEPVREGENVIALTRGEASITLEPGGQLELSGAALASAHDTCAELSVHVREMRAIAQSLDVVLLMMGRNPTVPTARMPWMPKERYAIMRRYLPTRGGMARDMMLGTGTVQTNIDYSDEADMARKLRVALGAAPILTALFANSPFDAGKPSGYLSTRSLIWEHTDPDRSGFIPGAFEPGFGYREYAEYALDVPMFFIHRNGHYLDYSGRSFRRFMEEGLDGHRATAEDWALHLTTLFPIARIKQYLELRMADVGPLDMICAFAALTRGLCYDAAALAEAEALIRAIPPAELPELQHEAARLGLRARAQGRPLQDWARDLLRIARGGLERLNALDSNEENEAKLLQPLHRIAESGRTLADELLQLWEHEWGRSLEPIFTSHRFTF